MKGKNDKQKAARDYFISFKKESAARKISQPRPYCPVTAQFISSITPVARGPNQCHNAGGYVFSYQRRLVYSRMQIFPLPSPLFFWCFAGMALLNRRHVGRRASCCSWASGRMGALSG